jgi:hypothetical protein
MRAIALPVLFAMLALAGVASARPSAPPSGEPAAGPDYIVNPEWAPVRQSELNLYRPVDAPTPGGAIVDCKVKADGRLTDCKTVEATPAHVNYEYAGPLAVQRLFRLKPTQPNGTSVEGKRVRVTVTWR